ARGVRAGGELPRHHLRLRTADLFAVAGALFPAFPVRDARRAQDAERGPHRRRAARARGDAGGVVQHGRGGGGFVHRRRSTQHGGVRRDVFLSAPVAHLRSTAEEISEHRAALPKPVRRAGRSPHHHHRRRDDRLPAHRPGLSHRRDRSRRLVRARDPLFRGAWTEVARVLAGGGVCAEASRRGRAQVAELDAAGRRPAMDSRALLLTSCGNTAAFPRPSWRIRRILESFPAMSDHTQKIISPVDGSVYAERPIARDTEIDAAASSARAALPEWRAVPIKKRADYMLAFLDALVAMNDEITVELAWQMGRPVRYGGERRAAEERVRAMAAMAEEALKPYVPPETPGFRRYIAREPLGIVLVIAPWNYPYLTALNTIVPGLLAGNAIILKHAVQTLLVGERIAQAFERAGLPKGLFHNLVMSHEQTEKLIRSGRIDHVNFTGSVAGGRAIERATAGTFASLGLELGGKDPAYVRADAKLDHAIENLVDGTFYNSGQCCCGVERIYVDAAVYDDFVAGFADLTRKYVVGNPLDQATTLGPMARSSFADTVREQIAEARRK